MTQEDYNIFILKNRAARYDSKGRTTFIVSSNTRRNGQMIISKASLKKYLKNGDITQQDIDNIRPY